MFFPLDKYKSLVKDTLYIIHFTLHSETNHKITYIWSNQRRILQPNSGYKSLNMCFIKVPEHPGCESEIRGQRRALSAGRGCGPGAPGGEQEHTGEDIRVTLLKLQNNKYSVS